MISIILLLSFSSLHHGIVLCETVNQFIDCRSDTNRYLSVDDWLEEPWKAHRRAFVAALRRVKRHQSKQAMVAAQRKEFKRRARGNLFIVRERPLSLTLSTSIEHSHLYNYPPSVPGWQKLWTPLENYLVFNSICRVEENFNFLLLLRQCYIPSWSLCWSDHHQPAVASLSNFPLLL